MLFIDLFIYSFFFFQVLEVCGIPKESFENFYDILEKHGQKVIYFLIFYITFPLSYSPLPFQSWKRIATILKTEKCVSDKSLEILEGYMDIHVFFFISFLL